MDLAALNFYRLHGTTLFEMTTAALMPQRRAITL